MGRPKALPIPTRKCGVCDVEFQPKRKSQIICTQKCFREYRQRQREAEFAARGTAPPADSRACASCGGPFTGDSLFVTCPSCRRPCSTTTGGCQRWGNTDRVVGTNKTVQIDKRE